ncbi:uncharacterized protein LOC133199769 [Saccostrea echinata]|uniref:uncharacterized protein LOC133198961 n=1 Tax=Saccostrea echinata TaxID=191078 RepID=UPI002A8341EF|nr:uncharacterized protein LOC133198961 [Saccostrea echinata]XP_061191599.1 uncharacterized protein LOC133199769 [Saccostrea echinata]
MASGGVEAKVYVVSASQERKTDKGEYRLTVVFDNTSKEMKQMTFPLKFKDHLLTGKFYLIKAVSIGDTIRLYETSRVFECGKFPLEMDKIKKYLNPPELSVEQVLESPQKSTVSVKGILRNYTDILTSPNSQRREITLESLQGARKVVCKLWGECAKYEMPPVDTIISATNVQVDQWRGEICLNSSVLTRLKETQEEGKFQGEVEALEVSENYSYIIVSGMTLKVRTDMIQTIFEGLTFKENINVKGSVKGTTVVDIQRFNPAKKTKKE